MKQIVLSLCSQHGLRVREGAKGLFGFYVKKKKSFLNKKHEKKRRALTHYLGQINNEVINSTLINLFSLKVQYFVSTLFAIDRLPV